MTNRETDSGSSPDRSSKKSKAKTESSPPGLLIDSEAAIVEGNKAELKQLIEKYGRVVDPLVRITFNTVNTTAAELQDVFKAAFLFMRRGQCRPRSSSSCSGRGNEPADIRF